MQVCPPGLHITLGIFYRLWCLLEEECHQLDLELATRSVAPQSIDRASFSEYSAAIKKQAELKEKKFELDRYATSLKAGIAQIATQVSDPATNPLLLALENEANSAIQRMQSVVGLGNCTVDVHVVLYTCVYI